MLALQPGGSGGGGGGGGGAEPPLAPAPTGFGGIGGGGGGGAPPPTRGVAAGVAAGRGKPCNWFSCFSIWRSSSLAVSSFFSFLAWAAMSTARSKGVYSPPPSPTIAAEGDTARAGRRRVG